VSSPALDQSDWRELTTWRKAPPSYSATWALLTDQELPETFRAFLRTLRHPFISQLQSGAGAAFHLEPEPVLETRAWNNRCANLVSGRFTEKLFQQVYTDHIEALGLALTETTIEHDWLDFLIHKADEEFTLGINVKNAGVQFRSAADRVGLAPDDTLPIATYKIFGSTMRGDHVPLVYVYLVDWSLLSKLRAAYWSALNAPEQAVFRIMTSFRKIPRKLEDSFIDSTVADRLTTLYTSVGYTGSKLLELPFRAISGRRCQRIFYVNHGRAPYVYVQRMNTDPNVHISVSEETVHFADFVDKWLRTPGRRIELLEGLGKSEPFLIPNPPI